MESISTPRITFDIARGGRPEGALLITPVCAHELSGLQGTERHDSPGLALPTGRLNLEGFTAQVGEAVLCSQIGAIRVHPDDVCMLLYGLGDIKKLDLTMRVWRKAMIGAFKKAATLKIRHVAVQLPHKLLETRFRSYLYQIGRITADIATTVTYQLNHFKTELGGFKQSQRIERVSIWAGLSDDDANEMQRGLDAGAVVGRAVNLARDTSNLPANICTPEYLAKLAFKVQNQSGGTIATTVERAEHCERLRMSAFLGVSSGSAQPPYFIVLSYTPKGVDLATYEGPVLGMVGKSVTFDSGGLNLKPGASMRDMKYDMCGGADVIAAMQAIAALKLPFKVKAFCAATENMTGSKAYRPGDVYVGMDGLSYEIDNTDAEGRLTLVDAISYARIYGRVTHLIDYATLTGAVKAALGESIAGVVSNNRAWCDLVLNAAVNAGEQMHQLPICDDFHDLNKSDIADVKNSGGALAGAITAGLFVLTAARDLPAVHVDIAGTAHRNKPLGADPAGATGFGVRTLISLAEMERIAWHKTKNDF